MQNLLRHSRKTEHPGFVETPAPRRRASRKSGLSSLRSDDSDGHDYSTGQEDDSGTTKRRSSRRANPFTPPEPESVEELSNGHTHMDGSTNGHAKGNGYAKQNGGAEPLPTANELLPGKIIDGWKVGSDPKVDYSGHFEFGGSYGVSAIMTGFPLLMYYMWIGATYYDGKPPLPAAGQSFGSFLGDMGHLAYTGAYPSLKAWTIYWTFFICQGVFYCLMPGVWTKGKPLPHEGGKRLDYYCSGMWSWWATIIISCALHVTGIFPLYIIIDEFGPIMSVAIISGILVSIVAYISALQRGKQHRMTGHLLYDFFMGAELNPRMFGILDFKMFFEVRLPWYILFLTTLGTAARQWERYGYVSGEVGLLLLAHFLYANACSKAEELIVPTWDMYYEKWGFMLIFWNLAGVPLTYCHCTLYLANHDPSTYWLNRWVVAAWYVAYIFVYWVWDTCNGQKNRFRANEHGGRVFRKAFPVLPYQHIENPRVIRSEDGGTILADGWCKSLPHIHSP